MRIIFGLLILLSFYSCTKKATCLCNYTTVVAITCRDSITTGTITVTKGVDNSVEYSDGQCDKHQTDLQKDIHNINVKCISLDN